jgi:alkaline phosphatase D
MGRRPPYLFGMSLPESLPRLPILWAVLFAAARWTSAPLLAQSLPDHAEFAARSVPDARLAPFYHGVASGDPRTDRVLLWTRLTTDSSGPQRVSWRVARDSAMTDLVREGEAWAKPSSDYTLHVDAKGLMPGTWYFYDFAHAGRRSVVGRTRTAPADGALHARFGVVSCSNYQAGWFNAYRHLAQRNDVEAILHLGDYIYEYESGGYGYDPALDFTHDPDHETVSLTDYRVRHAYYKLDEDLRRLHQLYPMIAIWDDHEFADDAWRDGAGNHDPSTEGDWTARKNAARQAYLEWMPIRRPDPADSARVYRRLPWGGLADLLVIDSRIQDRDRQEAFGSGAVDDPDRSLLGAEQFGWLKGRLSTSPAVWKVLVNQVMMAPLEAFGVPVNADQWDGYPAERRRLFRHVAENGINNLVVLTGDIHTSWAMDLPFNDQYEPRDGSKSVGVEFVCTSVTSDNLEFAVPPWIIQTFNDHVRYVNVTRHGYQILDLTPDRVQADYWFVNTVKSRAFRGYPATGWTCLRDTRYLVKADAPSAASWTSPPPRPSRYPLEDCPVPTDPYRWTWLPDSARLGWRSAPTAEGYVVQWRVLPGTARTRALTDTTTLTDTLLPGRIHAWRVAADCGEAGRSPWLAWDTFSVPMARTADPLSLAPQRDPVWLGTFPNPFSTFLAVKLFLDPAGERGMLRLLDAGGREVSRVALGRAHAGTRLHDIPLPDDLRPGVHVLELVWGDKRLRRRVLAVPAEER